MLLPLSAVTGAPGGASGCVRVGLVQERVRPPRGFGVAGAWRGCRVEGDVASAELSWQATTLGNQVTAPKVERSQTSNTGGGSAIQAAGRVFA